MLARVVSRPARDRIIFDSGSKTLTNDGARGFTPLEGYGAVLARRLRAANPIRRSSSSGCRKSTRRFASIEGRSRSPTGDLVRIVPNHSCVVSNLVDRVWIVDGDDRARVAAGGGARTDHVE